MKCRRFLSATLALTALSLSITAQIIREANTTLLFPNSLSTTTGDYAFGELFPGIVFDRPVYVTTPAGETNRLFVVERAGRIWVINDLGAPAKTLFMDISSRVHAADWVQSRRTEGLSSIAFHPDFASNRRFFVTYNMVTATSQGNGHHNRLAEFRANEDGRQGLPESEIPIITQFDEGDGHNINHAQFGPDGYLYVATGDEGDGGTGDDFNNANRIDKDFFAGILRIDVDRRTSNHTPNAHPAANIDAYKIPADNPFIDITSLNGASIDPSKVRTEFYAIGLRNPWRFSFDPQTQALYEGDVGQHGREEVNLIVKGGNYGWPFREGTLNGVKPSPSEFTSTNPIYQYGTGYQEFSGFSVTGGVVYRGANSPGLFGRYVFGDYESGHIWALNIDSTPYQMPTRIGASKGVASFGYDPRNGDVLIVNHDDGRIRRLYYSTGTPDNVPTSLDQTGIFANLATLQPHPGIYPYDVNAPLWSDDAIKRRWFSIPAGKRMEFSKDGNWTFPSGSVWIKHFEIQTRTGDASTAMRLETRVLYKTDSSVYGLTYRWNEQGTAATLVPEGGDTRGLYINTGTANRRQTWRYPSRSECLSCHTAPSGRVLGFTTAQMNRDYGYSSGAANQLSALSSADFFTDATKPAHPHGMRKMAPLNDASVSREFRVRSYLAANCAGCHQPGNNIFANWDARITSSLPQTGIIYGQLANTVSDHKVVTPGWTNKSAILNRMLSTGADRMPPLGTSVVDMEAIRLIADWIEKDLPGYESFQGWATRRLGEGRHAAEGDPDGDGVPNYSEYLLNTPPNQPTGGFWSTRVDGTQAALTFRNPANRGVMIEVADNVPSNNWRVLDHPQNQLRFPSEARDITINSGLQGPGRYYRMRVIEP